MLKILISKIYIFVLRFFEAFIISLSFAIFIIAIYPINIKIVSILSSIPFIIYLLSSLKFLKDEEIAWLYEFKYKDLNEKLITYIELKLKSIYNKIPFEKLNPFSIYKPRYEFFLLFVFSLALLVFSFTFRKPLYIANYGNYQRVVKIFGNDEFFLGEDIILKIKNYSFLKEKLILKPTNYSFEIKPISEVIDTIRNLDEGDYQIEFLGKSIFNLKVFQKPVIDSLIVNVKTPYLNLNQIVKNSFEISAIEGSKLDIILFSSSADSIKPFSSISLTAKNDTQFEFYLYKSKKILKYPTKLKISVIKDNPPFVKILYPENFIYLPENYKVPIIGISTDDYGLNRMEIYLNEKLIYRKNSNNMLKDTIFYNLDLSLEKLLPGDEIKVYLKSIDLKGQTSFDYITIKFPTLAEQMNLSNTGIGESVKKLKDLKQKIEDLSDILKKLDSKEDLNAISEELKNVQKEMEKLKEKINEISQKMSLEPEIQEQLKRISELYEKILDDELKQILNKIQEAINKLDRQEIRKMIEKMKIDIEKLKNSLKATESTLRKFYEEKKLKELSEKLKEIADKQENVNSKENQNEITKELKDIKENLDDISKTIETPFSDSLKNISNELQKNINQSENISENWPNSKGFCQSNAKSIRALSQKLENLQNQLVESRKEEIIKKIEALRRSLIFISQNEDVNSEFEQRAILNAIKIAIRDFEELSNMNFLITIDIKAHLYMALENAQEVLLRYKYNDFNRAKSYKNAEKKEILSAILKLYDAQNEVANSSSSSGYSEMLKKMAQTLSNMQSLSNQNLSEDLLKQITLQQEMLRKMIQGIREGMEKTGNKYSEKLKEIEKQIDDLEKEIKEKKKIDRRIIEKQREIMHNLLSAWTGLKSENKSEKLEAERPKDIKYEEPKISENMIYRQKIIEILRKIQNLEIDNTQKRKLIEFYQNLLKSF